MKIKIPQVIDLGLNNKAKVITIGGVSTLLSYETAVACLVRKGGKEKVYRLYDISTGTTWRHWNAFCDHIGRSDLRGPKGFEKLEVAETEMEVL